MAAAIVTVVLVPACASGHKSDPRAFCAATDRARQLGAEIQSSSLDQRATVQQKVHAASAAADSAADAAPSDIRHEARALADALHDFDERAAKATSSDGLTRAFTTYIDTAQNLTRQSAKVETWVRSHCTNSNVSTTTTPPTSDTGTDSTGTNSTGTDSGGTTTSTIADNGN